MCSARRAFAPKCKVMLKRHTYLNAMHTALRAESGSAREDDRNPRSLCMQTEINCAERQECTLRARTAAQTLLLGRRLFNAKKARFLLSHRSRKFKVGRSMRCAQTNKSIRMEACISLRIICHKNVIETFRQFTLSPDTHTHTHTHSTGGSFGTEKVCSTRLTR